jgi:peroxiredoxin
MNERSLFSDDLMTQNSLIKVQDPGINFSLKDQLDKTFDLFEQSGKRVLLSFHPLAWTAFCAGQMKSLEDNTEKFTSLNTVPVGISVDSVPCKKAWAEKLGITRTSLLCDFWPHGKVAQDYGLFRDANGFSERANIIIDTKMNVAFVRVYPVHSVPDISEVIGFIEKMKN